MSASFYSPGPHWTSTEEREAYEAFRRTQEPVHDSVNSGYNENLLGLRSGGTYNGMGTEMFWIRIHKKFPRLSDTASRSLAAPLSQSLSERTFSQITCAQTPRRANQSEKRLEDRLFIKGKSEAIALITCRGTDNSGGQKIYRVS